MAEVTLPNQDFLNRTFIEQKILDITNPLLSFADVVPAIKTDGKSVKFKKETVSASTDTKKKTLAGCRKAASSHGLNLLISRSILRY